MKPSDGRRRVVIEEITPEVDGGRYPVNGIIGDKVTITAAVFGDGHDHVAARLLYRHSSEEHWRVLLMSEMGNDIWAGSFELDRLGLWRFSVEGWIDHFDTWVRDLKKRLEAQVAANGTEFAGTEETGGQLEAGSSTETRGTERAGSSEIPLAFLVGAGLLQEGAKRAHGADAKVLAKAAKSLLDLAERNLEIYEFPLTEEIESLMERHPDLNHVTRSVPDMLIRADRERAQFSAWYEMFPRSASPIPGKHGSFRDMERQLPEIAAMNFDILYLPPIHPIGRSFRKGRNNSVHAEPGDPGSPWAIGDKAASGSAHPEDDGGHKSIHRELGTFADFGQLVAATVALGMEIALDIAFQCSPDHPWVTEHPEWFVIRPDGTIQYAENPPKKYQDIYPLNFESSDWRGLWDELYSVFEFWIKRGVHVFRVDNPHTKALPFWEWCLNKLLHYYPDTIFLAEAFTRPHVMYALAKAGFTQSYTYFTWRNTKEELQSYLEEITRPPVSAFFRPNFWPNTPDILHKVLQDGGRPAFMQRLILAATLTANYGIYGPAYELCENAPAKPKPGKTESEEYLDSEKYAIRPRDRNAPGSLVPLITALNRIRHLNRALQSNASLYFHRTDNPYLLCYSKASAGFANIILVAVNLDPYREQAGWAELDLDRLGISDERQQFVVTDLLTGAQYQWCGHRNFVALKPETQPAHIFRIDRGNIRDLWGDAVHTDDQGDQVDGLSRSHSETH